MTSPRPLADAWETFLQEYQEKLRQYQLVLTSTWATLKSQLDVMESELEAIDRHSLTADRLESLGTCFGNVAADLLVEPVRAWARVAPLQTCLTTLSDTRTFLDDVARILPTVVWTSGQDRASVAGTLAARDWRTLWLGRSKRVRPLALRAVIAQQLSAEEVSRARLDGEFQVLLAQASLHLAGPWHLFRQRSLDFFEDATEAPASIDRARNKWRKRKASLEKTAGRLLARYSRCFDRAPGRMAVALLTRPAAKGAPATNARQEELTRNFAYWSRQQRAIHAVLDLEITLTRLGTRMTALAGGVLDSLDEEHTALLAELESVIGWLQECKETGKVSEWPSEDADLVSAEVRLGELGREITRDELPETIETIDPKHPLPGWRKPWRRLHPEATAFRVSSRSTLDALREAEAGHRAILREMERAREVVLFSEEAARDEGVEGAQIAAEGIGNALSLLEYHRDHALPVRPVAERGMTRGLAASFLATYVALDQGRVGVLRHLIQDASERGIQRMWQLVLSDGRRSLLALWRKIGQLWQFFLYSLGLKTPPKPRTAAVMRAERLQEVLEFRVARNELPLIYRRLFRLEPIMDPRFLVGRDQEMAGLVEARHQWQLGKPVSIVMVGARGSGKTSLLNCATRAAFAEFPLIRTQFRERVTTPTGVEAFFREQLDLPPGVDLVEALKGGKRIVVLEEVERTFLRRMNGFDAIRSLLDLIATTWQDVLWVLSLNETAYHYLERAVGMGRFFTHRVNAMSVRLEFLRDAILMRHNLSGYRLSFPPPPRAATRIGRLQQRVGLQRDTREMFFEALHDQSEGVFRAAFELWQQHIERIDGGVVYLRPLSEPEYRGLLGALSNDDCFTLQAILQHGGLTAEELGGVFTESAGSGQSRLERLLALEILEPDPTAPGFRIQPEAGHLVRMALHRQNLI